VISVLLQTKFGGGFFVVVVATVGGINCGIC
jgi:hypothetical protein